MSSSAYISPEARLVAVMQHIDPESDPRKLMEPSTSGFVAQLYDMVTFGPQDLISWSPNGDSFVIGADLTRLEREVLPIYFRHSRFSSLIRQLNFYCFRKINRERTIWVYKHPLFQKDQPQDLHLVKRRACSTGVDGRKKRIVRISAGSLRPPGRTSPTDALEYDKEDQQSQNAESAGPFKTPCTSRPIATVVSDDSRSTSICSNDSETPVDTGLIDSPVMEDFGEHGMLISEKDTEQRVKHPAEVVTDVANQLAKYAREHNLSRIGRRGFVTPQVGHFRHSTMSSGNLLTYDDEIEDASHTPRKTVAVTTPRSAKKILPVSEDLALKIVDQVALLDGRADDSGSTAASLARLFLQTFPDDTGTLCTWIHLLLRQNRTLRCDFEQYRVALNPTNGSFLPCNWHAYKGFWRAVVVKDFLTLAANRLDTVIEKTTMTDDDKATMKSAMDTWQRNVLLLV